MAIGIILRNGAKFTVLENQAEAVEDLTSSRAGEWIEVEPQGTDGRTLVRRDEIAVVREIGDAPRAAAR